METSQLVNSLNPAQRTAVTAPPGHLLVLAGAGSGKTRVLTHRIAWLAQNEGISPYAMLAVTFTNKAAAEMRSRLQQILEIPTTGLWVGTFHGLAHRLLRLHWQEAGLAEHFQVIDSDDQSRILKRILKSLDLDEARWPIKQVQWYINHQKDEGIRPAKIQTQDIHEQTMVRIYSTYEENCERAGLVDFSELLLRAYELWLQQPDVLAHYQERFRYILVDEFQDTNAIQYAWLRILAGDKNYMMVVGDDDQSIYGWRGARIENIQRFSKDFPGSQVIRLEQNYRSTGTILAASNALIACNSGRLGKSLWTQGQQGELISLYAAFNEIDEARFIAERIKEWHHVGNPLSSIAILYRSNAQSRVLEETLIQKNIPYRIYGGLRFFERAEIKDTLAYLRLLANRSDDAAFERIVNVPTRGIGDQTLMQLRDYAKAHQLSLWHSAEQLLVQVDSMTPRARTSVSLFGELINKLAAAVASLPLHEQVEHVIQHSGLIDHYRKERGEKGEARLENLAELVTAAKEFVNEMQDTSPLVAFLNQTALDTGDAQAEAFSDCVQLMTLHAAKGLEFPLVILSGMEEGLFPHSMSANEPGRLEEERRLCYVGMTRAMQKLILTYAEIRRLHGNEAYHRASRFVGEIPGELMQEVRLKSQVVRPVSQVSFSAPKITVQNDSGFRIGQRVRHKKFGEGTVLSFEGQGSHARIQIKFPREGVKWLVMAYANLEPA